MPRRYNPLHPYRASYRRSHIRKARMAQWRLGNDDDVSAALLLLDGWRRECERSDVINLDYAVTLREADLITIYSEVDGRNDYRLKLNRPVQLDEKITKADVVRVEVTGVY